MARDTISERVERLEVRVSALEELPAHVADLGHRVTSVEVQIVQLRDEMRGEFSAVRQEMREGFAKTALRQEMRDEFAAVRQEMRAGFAKTALRKEMEDGFVSITSELGQQIVESRREAQAMFKEVMSQSRALHEDAIARFALLGEAGPSRRSFKRKR